MDENQIIMDSFEASSPAIKRLILLGDQNYAEKVGIKYNLTENQIAQLGNEIFIVLIGLELVSNFRSNLVNQLGISYDQALKIAFDVNSTVFNEVMDDLKEIENEIKNPNTGNTSQTQTSAPSGAEQILNSQMGESAPITPDHMLPDHETMKHEGGLHLHSQTVMPTASAMSKQTYASRPFVAPQPKPSFGSIVDKKLSNIVRSTTRPVNPTAPTNLPTNNSTEDSSSAPASASDSNPRAIYNSTMPPKPVGYQKIDPYREPIE